MFSKANGHKRILIKAMHVIILRISVSQMNKEPSQWPETGIEKG